MARSSKKASPKKLPKSLRKGRLPRSVGDVWSAGVGALAQARTAGGESFEALVALGAAVADTGSKAARGAVGQVEAAAGRVAGTARGLAGGAADGVQGGAERAVENVLSRMGVPTRDEVLALREQVEALRARLATLGASVPDTSAPAGNARGQAGPAGSASRPGGPDSGGNPPGRGPSEDAPSDGAPTAGAAAEAERAVYHVARHERGWSVQRVGTERAASVHPTKKEALHQARQTARDHAPSRLVAYKADGTVGAETDYDA